MSGWMFQRLSLLEHGLNAAWKRNQVIADNLANADTPGFKASHVEFESLLADAVNETGVQGKKTREKHMQLGAGAVETIRPVIRQSTDTTMRMDGNNVNVDKEMASLAMNSIQYNALVQKISKELGRIRMAVREG
jgi:flagellar basal-body rod protein FlgB